jgi:2,4-dienoyl-CoA reductase-like NADH-dependent reductase (Old Yellow Enzyme family)
LGTGLVAPSPEPFQIIEGTAPKGLKWLESITGAPPRELTTTEVEELEELYLESALRIKNTGFDGIEIHGGHGYLLAQFLSPLSNSRTDKYGGSFDKRLTLPRNIISKARERLGPDFVLGYRISGDEHVPGGLTLEDTKKIVPILVSEGLDFIHLSSGRIEALKHTFPEEEGAILPEARAIKEVAEVPVICPNIHTPSLAAQVINEGWADMVSLCRSLLADPEWPNKVREGREDEINRCILCNSCIDSLWRLIGTRCAVNPRVGKERFIPEYYPPLTKLSDSGLDTS